MRTKIKICGITNLKNALEAVALGVDALGFVFFKDSPRYIEPKKAREIINYLPSFMLRVGLFVNASKEEVLSAISDSKINMLHKSNWMKLMQTSKHQLWNVKNLLRNLHSLKNQ